MTPPLPPERRDPLDEADLRDKVREILTELLAGAAIPKAAPTALATALAGWRRRRQLALSVALGVLLVGAGLLVLLRTGLFSSRGEVPDQLVGVWKTSAPQYADRMFEITKTSIIFHTGGGSYTAYPIRRTEVIRDAGVMQYTLDYTTDDDQVAEFSFSFVETPAGMIRFKSQRQMVWRRAKL